MKLTFHGGARTVTGSKHLVEVNDTKILLDCGLVQGRRQDSIKANREFAFNPAEIDILVLSHAHIDHSGNIPNLVKNGFNGDIICTSATRDLCATMLPDSGHIQERDVEYLNKKRKRQGLPPVEPIYTQQDAFNSLDYFITQSYYRSRKIAPGVTLTFHDAGHMLGSAIVMLDIVDQSTNRELRLVFSGDIGRNDIPIIRDPDLLDHADILIMESTYGNRLHEPVEDAERKLEKVVSETYKRGGSIVMPSFAVGRTQQLVYTLHRLSDRGDIPHMPIYVDSPLAVDATSVFKLHPECFDDEIRAFMQEPGNSNPFGFADLTYIRKVEDSKRLNFELEPCIIISASGMVEFGRIVHHVKNRVEDARTTVLITGWQAPHTLGRRLVEGAETIKIFGDEYQRKAQVEVLNGFSGHADRDELLNWYGAMQSRPEHTFLVHGEEDSAMSLSLALKQQFNATVDVPMMGQSFDI